MSTGFLNPPLIQPTRHLEPDQAQRASALLMAQQILPSEQQFPESLAAIAEYIQSGPGHFVEMVTELDEIHGRGEARQAARELPWNPAVLDEFSPMQFTTSDHTTMDTRPPMQGPVEADDESERTE